QARTLAQRLPLLRRFRPAYFKPVIGLLIGLSDRVIGLSMGQTAENLVLRFGLTRAQLDAYAAQIHARVLAARARGAIAESVPHNDARGTLSTEDDGGRADSTPEKLARLKPVFDRPYGNIAAGNSSQVTDGAALLLLASERAVRDRGLRPVA